MSHAILSPSAASRWLSCTPSARLEAQFPESTSEFAEEGTLAHEFGETILRHFLKDLKMRAYTKKLAELADSKYYTNELQAHAENYAAFVWEKFQAAKKADRFAALRVEEKIDLTTYAPEGFGTGDAVIIADGTMEIIDLKYGKGVRVSAEENKQMMLYALGALDMFGFMYDIRAVRMTIFQPRLDNISDWEMPVSDLLLWGEKELKPRAAMAFKGEGEFTAGKHCKFCKAKAQCKALAEYNLSLGKYDFLKAELLMEDDISDILSRADQFKSWISSVEEYALQSALDGKRFPGFKLVEGRSNRKYSDEAKIASVLVENGFKEEQIYDRKLKTVTAMEKFLSKPTFGALCGPYVIKPEGKPTLVPDTDLRPGYNSAVNDFANININD